MKTPTTKLFPGALASIMEKNGINQVKLSTATCIAVSRINNYLQGKYRTIKPAHIDAIIASAATTQSARAELVKCYVLDLLPAAGKGLLTLDAADGKKDFEGWYLQKNRLPQPSAANFEQLYIACVSSPQVRERTDVWTQTVLEAHFAKKA